MPHWKMRLWVDNNNDQPVVGEPYWDDLRRRFGIAGLANKLRWFLFQRDDGLRVGPTQNFGGMVSDTTENPLVFDFSTSGEIRIFNKQTSTLLVRFTSAGALFTNASISGTMAFGGLVNNLVNGSLILPPMFTPLNNAINSTTSVRSAFMAPNWQLWCSSVNGGQLSGQWVAGNSQTPNSISVNVAYPSFAGGLRTFLHSVQQLRGNKYTFSVYITGPVGGTAKIRVLSNNSTLAMIDITGTGARQRYSIPLDFVTNPLDPTSTVLAFDALYAPKPGTYSNTWIVDGAQLNKSLGVVDLEDQSLELVRALARGIYYQGQYFLQTTAVPFNCDLLAGNVFGETDSPNVTLSNVTPYGGSLLSQITGQTVTSNVMLYRFPVLTESN